MAVSLSLPVASVKDLMALAKTKPGTFNYASNGIGSINHLTAELFKSMAGVNIVHIAYYNSTGPALTDLIAGQVQVMFASALIDCKASEHDPACRDHLRRS
jgi:tripartite-type tricarboxylate transporter receptor subunit TctC